MAMVDKINSLLRRIRGRRILTIGDVMLDRYIWGDATRISPEAPVPVVRIERESGTAGGAANVALNLRALGVEVDLVGSVGCDAAGDTLCALLEERNIAFDRALRRNATDTIVKTRVMCRKQQLCRLDQEAPPADYSLPEAWLREGLAQRIRMADAVILSDYAKGVVTSELVGRVQRLAGPGKLVALDPKPRERLAFRGLGLITPNRVEALQLAHMTEIHGEPFPAGEVCRRLYQTHGADLLVITMGADGMLISRAGRVERQVPTAAREVFDVSGAGDTVTAVLTAALSVGADAADAVQLANLAAGVVVAKVGTASATPEEILAHAGCE